jgi:acetyl-CoA acetyltransferase
MRQVAIVGFASAVRPMAGGRNDAELLAPVVDRALTASGLARRDIGVVGTAGSEFLNGVVGGIMGAFDALPCWPPRSHSHLEGDGAFALYECWVRLAAGEADAALVGAFSRPSAPDERSVLGLQLDPYLVGPLRAGPISLAALQARVLIDEGRATESDLAEVVRARRRGVDVDDLLRRPYVAAPLRDADCSTVCAGAAAAVLAAGDLATRAGGIPAWITEIEQRVERQSLGARHLSASATTAAMAIRMGLTGSRIDVLELHAPFSHQELILEDAVGAGKVGRLNPSGGALPADPIMATGLIRIGAAAESIMSGEAHRAVGHATNGPCLQHNLLCLMEAGL